MEIDKERARAFLYKVASGESVRLALGGVGVSFEDYCSWRVNSVGFDLAVRKARRVAADEYVDKMVASVESAVAANKSSELSLLKLRVEMYQWLAERLNSELYGAVSRVESRVREVSDLPQVVIEDKGVNGDGRRD